jgi:serine/threonine protein kinase
VAVKVLEKERISEVADVERVTREIHILKRIRHANIIQLYEIIETKLHLYLIMEYCSGGELFDYIVSHTRVKEKEACVFFQQLIAGVEYIHKLGIVHRDLKPENLLLNHNKEIKIVDFGLSNLYKPGELLKTACGSPCYAAPEMIAGKKYVASRVDIWSCGVILFAVVCGYLPFEDPNTNKLYKKIMAGSYEIPNFISNEARDLIKNILNIDPEKRYTVEDVKKHPWFNMVKCEASAGILVGYDPIPIDNNILSQLSSLHLDIETARRYIEANKHDNITTSYYLLLKKHLQNGGTTTADYANTSLGSIDTSMINNKISLNNSSVNTPHPPAPPGLTLDKFPQPIFRRRRYIETDIRVKGSSQGMRIRNMTVPAERDGSNPLPRVSYYSPKSTRPNVSISPINAATSKNSTMNNPRQRHLRLKFSAIPKDGENYTPRPPNKTPVRSVKTRGRALSPQEMNESTNFSLNNSTRYSPRAVTAGESMMMARDLAFKRGRKIVAPIKS